MLARPGKMLHLIPSVPQRKRYIYGLYLSLFFFFFPPSVFLFLDKVKFSRVTGRKIIMVRTILAGK